MWRWKGWILAWVSLKKLTLQLPQAACSCEGPACVSSVPLPGIFHGFSVFSTHQFFSTHRKSFPDTVSPLISPSQSLSAWHRRRCWGALHFSPFSYYIALLFGVCLLLHFVNCFRVWLYLLLLSYNPYFMAHELGMVIKLLVNEWMSKIKWVACLDARAQHMGTLLGSQFPGNFPFLL